jgi:mitochondrial fission protein ELM1
METVSPLPLTWIVTDAATGHEAQGIAIAEALGFPFKVKRVQVRGVLRWIPPRLQLHLDPRRLLSFVSSNEPLRPPWPRIIVSIGRRSVPIALALKRLSQPRAFAVHIQDPKVSARHFDWIAAPLHDGLSGPNVLTTLGSVHRVTPEKIAEARRRFAQLIEPLPTPRVAVLLGGQSRAFEFTAEDAARFGTSLAKLARENGGSLLVTPSRRTATDAVAALSQAVADVPHYIWDGSGENPYFALLGFAEAIVVTEDSISMVTEAAGTGKPVYVQPLRGRSRRNARFHALMRDAGATRPFDGRLERWSYTPINDTQMVANLIRSTLGLSRPS